MPGRSGEVVAANFVLRYAFSCLATVTVVPGIKATTVTAAFLVVSCLAVLVTVKWGASWREIIHKK
jgi:hypothetical protein